MKRDRFWTGVAILVGLVMLVVHAVTPRPSEPTGAVDGTVMYQGRPLEGGQIYFEPKDPERSGRISAIIDSHGHFECDPDWARDPRSGMWYEILILLGPRNFPSSLPPSDRAGGPEGGVRPGAEQDGKRGANRRVVLASLRREVGAPTERDGASVQPRRPRPVRIVQEEVWLDPEPAYIDIHIDD